jgi:Ca2+/Na+ antiporter
VSGPGAYTDQHAYRDAFAGSICHALGNAYPDAFRNAKSYALAVSNAYRDAFAGSICHALGNAYPDAFRNAKSYGNAKSYTLAVSNAYR